MASSQQASVPPNLILINTKAPTLNKTTPRRFNEPPPPPVSPVRDYLTKTPWSSGGDDRSLFVSSSLPEERPSPPSSAFGTATGVSSQAFAMETRQLQADTPGTAAAARSRPKTSEEASALARELAIHKQRAQWQHQMAHEQRMQRQHLCARPLADQKRGEPSGNIPVAAPITLRGEPVRLPTSRIPQLEELEESWAATAGPPSPPTSGRSPRSFVRHDGARWPSAPPTAAEGTPRRMNDRLPAGWHTAVQHSAFVQITKVDEQIDYWINHTRVECAAASFAAKLWR